MGNLRGRRSCRHCLCRCPPPSTLQLVASASTPGRGAPQDALPVLPGLVPVLPPVGPVLPPVVPAPTGPPSHVRQNYHPNCEAAVNRMINLELHASYMYRSLAFYEDRQDLALKHFGPSFLPQSREAEEPAEMLMRLQNRSGRRIRLRNIRQPDCKRWENLDRILNQRLLDLHQLAAEKRDAHLCDYLERHYLPKQVKSMEALGGNIINLRQMGAPESGLADYLFDKLTLGDSDKKN